MKVQLKDKIAVITGGAQGIGRTSAEIMAAEGATVIVGDMSFKNRDNLMKQDFSGTGTIYEAYLDVTKEEVVKKFFQIVVANFKTVDVLYNNAGICRVAVPFEELPQEKWDTMFAVNTFGSINCIKEVIPLMKAQRSGKIIISTSVAAEVGGIRTEASYAATKAANICVTMSLAKYLGPYNVNVNAVSPGVIATSMTASLDPVDATTIPLQRIGQPEDVGNVVLFLSCHMSDYLTGVVIDVNGGQHFR